MGVLLSMYEPLGRVEPIAGVAVPLAAVGLEVRAWQ